MVHSFHDADLGSSVCDSERFRRAVFAPGYDQACQTGRKKQPCTDKNASLKFLIRRKALSGIAKVGTFGSESVAHNNLRNK